MNKHRMFSSRIGNSARFLQMPYEAQLLYFHMILRADDDGVVEVYPVVKLLSVPNDNLKILIAKNYLHQLNEDQVMLIMDWTEHNKIRADRKVDSIYKNLIEEQLPEHQLLPPKPRSDVVGGQRHNAIKNGELPYNFSATIRKAFIGEQCPMCNKIMVDDDKDLLPSIQHNQPLSLGGKHDLDNISIVCFHCNVVNKNKVTDDLNNELVKNKWYKIHGRTTDGQRTAEGKVSKGKLSKDKLYRVGNLILKYLPIRDIENQTSQRYLKSLLNSFDGDLDKIENLLKAVKYFATTAYPYTIYSVKSLYEKKDKIIARVLQEKNKANSNQLKVIKI